MRCCKRLCGEEKPTVLGFFSKENKQLSRDMIKAYKNHEASGAVGKAMIIHYFLLCKDQACKN